MADMIPRAEADARVVAAFEAMRQMALDIAHEHLARVQPHDPDDSHPVDKVAQGYGNAALNISADIRALTPDDARAALLEKALQDVVVAQYDDGSRIYFSSYAGGAAIGGEWSEITLVREDQDGSTFSRRYEAREEWSKAPSAALQENTDNA